MRSVLIADDEVKVCQLIRRLVPWEELGLTVCAMAHDGLSALEAVRVHRPDILITDIRMPGLDGIQLIREAKELCPQLHCIIISGYKHFDYAHNAIKYGVQDYLLKPLQQQEIVDTLRRLLSQTPPEENTLPDGQALFEDLLREKISPAQWSREWLWERHQLALPEGMRVRALLVQVDLAAGDTQEATRRIAAEKARDTSLEMLSACAEIPLRALLPGGAALLLCFQPIQAKELLARKRQLRTRLEAMRDLFPTLRVSMGISEDASDFAGVLPLFPAAYRALQLRLLSPEGDVYGPVPEGKRPRQMLPQVWGQELVRQLEAQAQAMQVAGYEELLCQAFAVLRRAAGDDLPVLRAWLREAVRLHFSWLPVQLPLSEMEQTLEKFEALWERSMLLEGVEEGFVALLTGHLAQQEQAQRSMEQRPLRKAKAYIMEHYQESLTLETVSEIAGFHPTYFSSLFKKETGEGFLAYLSSVRMKAAKRLLTEGDLSIGEVGERSGYVDQKYFCKQFKKATGLSPQEYRKLYG